MTTGLPCRMATGIPCRMTTGSACGMTSLVTSRARLAGHGLVLREHELLNRDRDERQRQRQSHERAHTIQSAKATEIVQEALEHRHGEQNDRCEPRRAVAADDSRREQSNREDSPT